MVCGIEAHCAKSFHKTKPTTEREFCCYRLDKNTKLVIRSIIHQIVISRNPFSPSYKYS